MGIESDIDEIISDLEQEINGFYCDYELHNDKKIKKVGLKKLLLPEKQRGHGVGSNFMSKFVSILDKYAYDCTVMASDEFLDESDDKSVTDVISFYKKFGFHEAGQLHKEGDDTQCLMERDSE